MRNPVDRRLGMVVAVCLALASAAAWSFGSRSVERAAAAARPEEADSLGRYLEPVGAAPRLDDYAAFLPAAPARAYHAPAAPADEPAADPWEVSAIVLGGRQPVAIFNDEAFAAGEWLSDGTVVLAIERDHVVVRAPNGALSRLLLNAGYHRDTP